jgi:methionyl-tRNA formyltransferase
MKKAVFFVMTKKGLYALENFINAFGREAVEFVVSHTDKHVEKDYYDEIKQLCSKNRITFYNKNSKYLFADRFVFVIGWRWIIKSTGKLYIFHDSLLPKYRGYAPVVSQLMNKENYLGVTCFLSENRFDESDIDKGCIISRQKTRISYPVKISEAIDKVCPIYSELLNNLYRTLISGKIPECTSQNSRSATYSVWRDEEDYMIDWKKDAEYIKRFIDSVGHPYLGAFTKSGTKKIRIIDSVVFPDEKIENRDPGKVLFIKNNFPVVICGKGLLKITEAIDDNTRQSILPLKKFRTRFY